MNPYYTAIAQRANHRCEYCKAPEVVFNFPFEVEHIVPLSRQGSDDDANLALACRSCNLRKGNRISGLSSRSNVEARFFHPRKAQWDEHFQINVESGEVVGVTPIGEVTVEYLEMNSSAQVAARQLWIRLNLFP
ncbi:HNH endonuclease [Oscillatoria sp. FACHB-1407]|uniref:HNH endonuclease n=1 Tax=Oscillatoria sp. FACHB-1407 TaxID=2692847 RepID=UPI0016857FE4|nr:HNH endonuclease signature motif containing protein [Oscillatoria sp. FACHB-1407]MBD2460354.1 HNH endonuclease [Oscillatoria sp. FACHB-1407]